MFSHHIFHAGTAAFIRILFLLLRMIVIFFFLFTHGVQEAKGGAGSVVVARKEGLEVCHAVVDLVHHLVERGQLTDAKKKNQEVSGHAGQRW